MLEEGVFVGPKSIIMPGVIIRKNTFIRAGSVITKSTNPNTIVCGNPQKEKAYLSDKLISRIILVMSAIIPDEDINSHLCN